MFCKVFNKRIVLKFKAESRDETPLMLFRAVTGYLSVGILHYGPLPWYRSSSYIFRSLAPETKTGKKKKTSRGAHAELIFILRDELNINQMTFFSYRHRIFDFEGNECVLPHRAASRKIVQKKCTSARDKAEEYCGKLKI